MRARVAVILGALALGLLSAATAKADRPATTRETVAVRAAALRTPPGAGWRVTHVRVSTVRTLLPVQHTITRGSP